MQWISYFLLLSSCGRRRNGDVCSSAGNIWLNQMYWVLQQRQLFPKLQGSMCHFSFCAPFRDFTLQTRALWFGLWGSSWPAGPDLYFCLKLTDWLGPCLHCPSFSLKTIAVSSLTEKWCRAVAPAVFSSLQCLLPSGPDLWLGIPGAVAIQSFVLTSSILPWMSQKTQVAERGLWISVRMVDFKIFLNLVWA